MDQTLTDQVVSRELTLERVITVFEQILLAQQTVF